MRKTFAVLCIIFLFAVQSFAATYYVATTGDNEADGSSGTPWLTIKKCGDTIASGDTCFVLAGTYNEYITPVTSGADNTHYITYAAYQNQAVIMRGFNLTSKNYIKIIGFDIRHDNGDYTVGVKLTDATFNQILNNTIHYTNNGAITASATTADNIIRGNTIEYPGCANNHAGSCLPAGAIEVDGNRNLYEYNSISHIPDYFSLSQSGSTANIIRNNYLGPNLYADYPDNTHVNGTECINAGVDNTATDPVTGAYTAACCLADNCLARHIDGFQITTTYTNVLFERNYLEQTTADFPSDKHSFWHSSASSTETIIRENLFYGINGSQRAGSSGLRYYNNTSVESLGATLNHLFVDINVATASTDNKAFNNVFYNSSTPGTSKVYCLSTDVPANELIADYDCWSGFTSYENALCTAASTWGGGASASVNDNPHFNAGAYTLSASSHCSGIGVTQTTAHGAGVATVDLVVHDARPFVGQDWAVNDASGAAVGDTIIIGTNDPVKITAINYATGAVTLASAQSWADNATVRLSHQAATPDAGAYPYRATTYSLTGTWVLSGGTVTVTPSDASLVRFVEVFENGVPVNVAFTSPYTVAGVGAGTVTAKIYSLYASSTPVVTATAYNASAGTITSGVGGGSAGIGAGGTLTLGP